MKKKNNKTTDAAPAPEIEPNLAFVGARRGREPLTDIFDGGDRIKLPAAEEQSSPFYHEEAARIARLFPVLYKLVKTK